MSDGSVTIDTKLNNKEFKDGLNELESIGKKGLKGLTVATGTVMAGLTALGGYAIKVGSDFESGMSKVQAISGATGEEIDKLTEKAKEMGAKTKFSASESAEAFQYMAMAGWKTEDMLNGIEGIMNLAAASGEELASVSDIVTDALTAFGLQAKDSAHFADVLAKASSNSNTNVGLMGETFKYVAPLAGSMKYSVEDTAVAIGLMANAGIKGSQAGTALRSMLTRLVKPPKEAATALDKLNISAKNSDGTMKPLSQTIQELRKKFANLSESQKASYAASIAGQEAMSGMLAIVNASDDDFNKLTKAINNSEGATKEMADTMNNNLKGATTIMQSNMESLGLAIYEKFKGPATKGIKSVTENLEKLTKETSNGKLSKSLDRIASSFGKLIEKGASLISKVLPKLIDGLAWVLDNGKTIAKVIGTIAGAIAILKTTANISKVVQGFQKAQVALSLFTLQTKGATVAQGVLNGSLTIGETIVALLTGKITLATVAQKLWNAAMATNPIGIVTVAVAGLTAGLVYLATRQTESQKQAKEFAEEISNAKKEFEAYNESINNSAKANLLQIESVSRLKNELSQLVDENGKVKKGYEGRVSFILNQLNESLGTEYKLNQNIISSYKDLQKEIDGIIAKKKAKIILDAEEEKYTNAIKNEEELVGKLKTAREALLKVQEEYGMSLDELRTKAENSSGKEKESLDNVINAYDNATQAVKSNVEIQKQYASDYALFTQGKYDEMGKSIINTTSNWSNTSLETIRNSIVEQAKELENCKATYESTESEILKTQKEQAEQNLKELAQNLADRTSTVKTLGANEYSAWKTLAEENYRIYSEQLGKMHPTLKEKIENLTGYLQGDTSLPESMQMLTQKTTSQFEQKMKILLSTTDEKLEGVRGKIDNNIGIPNTVGMLMQRTGEVIDKDESIENATKNVLNRTDIIMRSQNSSKWGEDMVTNFGNGISRKSNSSWFTGVLNGLASKVSFYMHHSTPDKGPLKDDDKWMPDMMDNFAEGIKKNTYKVTNQSEELARKIKNSLDIDKTYEKMKATVDYETTKLSANLTTKAMLQVEKDQVRTVTNDNGVTINNTQQFYSKSSTPYEEQKQAKQQLRRLAYGL